MAQNGHFNVVVCGDFIASRDDFHMDALLHVTVLEELSHWLTAHSWQDKNEINFLCAGQREGGIVGFHLKRTEETRAKSSTTVAQPSVKMLKVAPISWLVGFQKAD